MSNEISNQKFYRFLANFQQGEQTWADVADSEYGNDNGTVIKSEFRAFMQGEWTKWNGEEGGTLSNSLINNFWKKLDTNTKGAELNKLNQAEMDKANAKIEAYVELNDFVKENVTRPVDLKTTGARWESDVADDLAAVVEKWIQGEQKDDLNELLTAALPAILNKNTAEYSVVEYQETLKKDLLKDYPEYNVALDDTLNKIIEDYLGKIDVSENAEAMDASTIYSDIKGIMDAYLHTAGIGEGSDVNLADYGYEQDANAGLNDIQKSVAKQNITNNMKAIESETDYKDNKELYDTAINNYITAVLEEAEFEDFETIKNYGVNEFKDSDEGKKLTNRITVEKDYKNLNEQSAFYSVLKAEFGESLAKTIAQDGRYITAYQDILNDVLTKIEEGSFVDANGGLDNAAIQEHIVNEIAKNLESFFPNGLGDMSLTELKDLYAQRSMAADSETDNAKSLEQHRNAALDYCEALVKMHKTYENEVIKVFGNDWKSAIEKMYPSEIKDKIATLEKNIDAIPEPTVLDTNTTVAWAGVESFEMTTGTTNNENTYTATIADVDAADVKYVAELVSGNGSVDISDLGKLSVTAGGSEGYIKINVYAEVDGQRVGSAKEVTVKVNETPAPEASIYDSATLSGVSGTMQTTFKKSDLNSSKNDAITSVKDLVNGFKSGLISEGMDESKVTKAINATVSYYKALINALTDKTGSGRKDHDYTVDFEYTDANGQTVKASDGYRHIQDTSTDDAIKHANDYTSDSGVAIMEHVRTWKKNEWAVSVQKRSVVEKFIEFYNSIK